MDVRESEEHPFLGRAIAQPRQVSEATAHKVDSAVREILTIADVAAAAAISEHREAFDRLVSALEESETLERDAIEEILGQTRQPPSNVIPIAPKG